GGRGRARRLAAGEGQGVRVLGPALGAVDWHAECGTGRSRVPSRGAGWDRRCSHQVQPETCFGSFARHSWRCPSPHSRPPRRPREQIIEAAETGDPEKLRPIFEANGEPPALSFAESDDPIEAIKALSGDPEGREILAILIEVLEAGYVHVDVGTPDEMYIWP